MSYLTYLISEPVILEVYCLISSPDNNLEMDKLPQMASARFSKILVFLSNLKTTAVSNMGNNNIKHVEQNCGLMTLKYNLSTSAETINKSSVIDLPICA